MASDDGLRNGLTRRAFGAAGMMLLSGTFPSGAQGIDPIGAVLQADGNAYARLVQTRKLQAAAEILLGDFVWTEARARVALALGHATKVYLGPRARLTIDRFVAERGGELRLGTGSMVFDRPEDADRLDIQIQTAFGLIGVRGTRFFAGRSRRVFGIHVARGLVIFEGGGSTREIRAGQGIDIAAPGARPTLPRPWGAARVAEAYASVLG